MAGYLNHAHIERAAMYLTKSIPDGVDILTHPAWILFQYDVRWGCDCGCPEFALHRQSCSVSPLYAATVESLGFSPLEIDTSIGFSMFNLIWKDWK